MYHVAPKLRALADSLQSVQKESEPSRTIPSGVARESSGAGASELPVTCYHDRSTTRLRERHDPRLAQAQVRLPIDWVV